eukprot:TRINITY_DN22346_c0_g1_i1.p1 TRINITY_DN22346_c0_g1~~TRINITY_DN22346_c0_g1_i1.p1  ORF type:complete len:264 (-),score=46.03 TRINITY_DN22346_c0_g1_i1:60-851(-)
MGEERKVVVENKARKQEGELRGRPGEEVFDEEDFEFRGEGDLAPPPDLEDIDEPPFVWRSVKNGNRSEDRTLFIVGWSTISPDFRTSRKIAKTVKPERRLESNPYLTINAKTHPVLAKLARKERLREVGAEEKGLCNLGVKTALTWPEIEKRAEILAKLYVHHHRDELVRYFGKRRSSILLDMNSSQFLGRMSSSGGTMEMSGRLSLAPPLPVQVRPSVPLAPPPVPTRSFIKELAETNADLESAIGRLPPSESLLRLSLIHI